jgi:hypothetical protein
MLVSKQVSLEIILAKVVISLARTHICIRWCAKIFSFAHRLIFFCIICSVNWWFLWPYMQIHIQNDHFFMRVSARISLGHIELIYLEEPIGYPARTGLNLEEPTGYPAHIRLISPSIRQSVCLSIHLSVCLSVCLEYQKYVEFQCRNQN